MNQLISPKLWLILSVMPLLSLVRYLILSQVLSNTWSNNNKCLNLTPWTLINPSISSNLINNGFEPVEVLCEMLQTKIFSCDLSSLKILSRSRSSILIISSK